jgi:signal transduction histidine kinase
VLQEVVAKALVGVPVDVVVLDVPDDLPLVLADPGLLERVIANLVDNARRFSPSGVPVRVTAWADDFAYLRVADSGPGVPDADWDRMFTPFQRLGDQRSETGVGLGLAIARGFSEATGGSLVPSSTPGGGLTMTVQLPLMGR